MKEQVQIKRMVCISAFLLASVIGFAQSPQTFNSSASFTVPAGIYSITIETWGGGGHGSNRTNSSGGNTSGGGGGGAYARSTISVTPGSNFTVNVGSGSSSTSPGADSWFGSTTTILAKGGASAANNSTVGAAGGLASASIGTVKYNGGYGAAGSGSSSGGGGSSAGSGAAGVNGFGSAGGVATANGGNGGDGRTTNNGSGDNGNNPGGGGGGAYRSSGSQNGGNGADGRVIVSWVSAPEINMQGNTTNVVSGDLTPSAADHTVFTTTPVGTPVFRTYTIQNIGSANLTLGAITFSGTNAVDFSVSTAPGSSSIGVGASTTFSVRLLPSAAGLRSATLSLVNNDSDENPYIFALEGTATEQEINLTGNGNNIIDGSTTPSASNDTNFGSIPVGTTILKTFTVQNTGTLPLTIGTISFSGVNAGEFSVTSLPAASVAAGGTTTFSILFTPTGAGNRIASIAIANNDGDENPYDFSILGTGTLPEINILGNGVSIVDGDSTPSLSDYSIFATTPVGIAVTRTYTIQNTGIAPLSLGAVSFTGTNGSDFSVFNAPAATVASGGNTTFTISFTPSAAGVRNASFSIANNDSDENPYDFSIQGNATEQEINIQGNSVNIVDGALTTSASNNTNFGSASVGTPVLKTFVIQNTGTLPLTIGAISFSGTNASEFTVYTPPGTSVAPGANTPFTVAFSPIGSGLRSVTIAIANNDGDENPYDFAISGTVAAQEINMLGNGVSIGDNDTSPSTSDWTNMGSSPVGIALNRTYTIQNTGGVALNIGAATITGTDASSFSITSFPAASVAPGGSTTITVSFIAVSGGGKLAELSIINDDLDENPYNFFIQGTGTLPEINFVGNGNSIVSGDPTPSASDWTLFSTTSVGVATTRTFTIQNTGLAPLNLGAVTFSGTNATDFTVTTGPAASVASGGNTTISITLTPSAAGVRTAVFSIVNNDSDENPYFFSIQGTATEQEINVTGNSVNIVDGDTTPATSDWTDFGNTVIGSTFSRTFTIQNTGTLPLTLGAITISGTDASNFVVTTAPASTVAAGGNTTVVISFTPLTPGLKSASFAIVNNDGNENPYDFSIQGTGTAPEINLIGKYVSIVDGDITPDGVDQTDFGSVSIDSGSVTVTYTIQNTGTSPLSVGAVNISGANATDFSIYTLPAPSIPAGGSTSVQISFNPTTLGIKNARLSIVNDDADENPYDFSIMGTGVRTYVDTDNDGVSDNYDLDDDNDGVVDSKEQSDCVTLPYAALVDHVFLNETFGTGTTKGQININIPGATCGYCYEDGIVHPNTVGCPTLSSKILDDGEYCVNYKITGATASDPENVHGDLAWYSGEDHTPGDTYGRMAIFNASYAAGTFYETTVNGVLANAPITYSFWALNIMSVNNYAGSRLPNITVEFLDLANNVLATYNTAPIGRCSGGVADNSCALSQWLQYATTVNLGNVTDFIIRLKNISSGGSGNDLALDDIVIKQKYCDSDNDGTANIFDLDSDNDGIADIEEAGFKQYSSGLSRVDMTTGSTWSDSNHNGLDDPMDARISAGTYIIPDTDSDGIVNMLDLDSDNDSQFDVDEAGIYNGDGDINGDGLGDGIDTDGDGILNIYDTSAGFGTNARPFAQDTDTNGTPDYMQLDSNSDGVTDIAGSLYANLDANGDGVIDGTADIDKDGIRDSFDTNTAQVGSPRNLNRKLFLDFDGRNDYGEGNQLLSGLPQSTIMCWIKLGAPYTADGTVIGQDNFNIKVNLNGGNKIIVTANGISLSYSTAVNVNQWYHVAAVYDGTHPTEKLRLYINGSKVAGSNIGLLAGSLNASTAKFTFGKSAVASTNYFKGSIDEVRVFNSALTDDILRKMVYQEIKLNGTAIRGEFIPKDIELSAWSSLLAYYRMDAYKNDVIDDYLTSTVDDGLSPSFARIYNVKNIKYQLAPMPFVTTMNGAIDAAVSQNNFVNGTDAMAYDWSIIWIKNNINFTFNQTSLGMVIDPGTNVTLNNNNQLKNTWYLKLDGKLDLQDRSQLVQTLPSDLDPASSGSLERDQQGQSNLFNYNYWSSPVGTINATTNNNSYTVAGVMRDGTVPSNVQPFNWTSSLNGSPTSPVTLSSYWIFKFQNLTPVYANWASVGPNGTLLAGQGYTLKGSGAASPTQNFTFVGKPNNGTITSPIAANNLNLSGNPYPSALDTNAFITANNAATTGTLYFWEHFGTNSSHNLADYQGGYATRNLVGGTPPVSPSGISGLGSSTRIPGRFVPVGQGFFVNGSNAGGNITFTNSQRAFIKEDNASSSLLFRHNDASSPYAAFNNNDDEFTEDTFSKIRIGFNSPNDFHRQLLLGFMNEYATSGVDVGYDAPHIDSQPNDMYFMNGTAKLVIEGDTYFSRESIFPLGVKNNVAGNVKFTLDATEHFDDTQDIYIYDAVTDVYHDIKGQPFEIELPGAVTINDRFSLRFKTATSLATHNFETDTNDIIVAFTNDDNMITVKNHVAESPVKTVMLFNMLGQSISKWTVESQDQKNIQIPVSDLSTGTYIVKVLTTNGDISKKVIIN